MSKTPTPPAPDWEESAYLRGNDFDRLAERRVELKLQLDAIEQELSELNLEIGAMLATADTTSVKYGSYRITLGYSSKGGKISKERLLEAGVTEAQILKATSAKELGAPYITVTSLKQHEEA